ncbi:zinc finger protein [Saccharopolyspora sp. ID03-671]|uniref:zinc finger protein n=1 Tax=Saccharopolyspora sp. ID03-671 TaxID=3073066 RepID=UPI003872AFEB
MTHPVRWTPAEGERHATAVSGPGSGKDTEVLTLCGKTVTTSQSDRAWFWETCQHCNREAHRVAGVPMPPATGTEPVRP